MKLLTVVIMLLAIMVPSVASMGFVSQAKADDNVIILSHTIFQDYGPPPSSVDKGDYQVAGEVQNVGTLSLHFNVTAEFYNSNNEIIGSGFLSDSHTSYLHVLLPGKKSPFVIFFSRFNEEGDFRPVDHYSLKITSSPANLYQSGFEILSQTSHETRGTLLIEGEIKNIGTEYVDGFMVFATFYNETGEVVAVASEGGGYAGIKGFPPNQTAYFSTKIEDFTQYGGRLQRIDKYELTAEGYDYSLWTADGQLIDPEIVYVLGSVPKQEEETPKQPEDAPIALYAATAAIAAILIILTLLVLRKRGARKNKIAQ
jgi:hypothetical protein